MRVLVTIPHFHNPKGGGAYGSTGSESSRRADALSRSIAGLHSQPWSFGEHASAAVVKSPGCCCCGYKQASLAQATGPLGILFNGLDSQVLGTAGVDPAPALCHCAGCDNWRSGMATCESHGGPGMLMDLVSSYLEVRAHSNAYLRAAIAGRRSRC